MHKALRLFAGLSCLTLAAASAQAQTRPTFEVASIRPAAPLDLAKVRKYQIAISFSMEDLTGAARAKWIDEPNPPAGAGAAMPAEAASDPSGSSSLFKAVGSMGLKLVPRKVTVEELVIDHIEKTPTVN